MSEMKGSNRAFRRKRSEASCASQDGLVKNRFKPARKTLGLELVASPELLLNNEWREFDEPKKTSPLRKLSSKRFGSMPSLKSTRRKDAAEKSSETLNSSTALVRPSAPAEPDTEATPASSKASRVGSETRRVGSLLRQTGRQSSELISTKIHSLSFRSKNTSDLPMHPQSSFARQAMASPLTIRDRRPNQRRVVEAAKSVKFAATNEEMAPQKPKHHRARSTGNAAAPASIMKASSFAGAPRVKQPLNQACYGDFLCNSASHSNIHDVGSVESRNRSLARLHHLSSFAMPGAVSRCRDGAASENLSAAQQLSASTTPVALKTLTSKSPSLDTESSSSTSGSPKSVANDLLSLQPPSDEEDDDVDLNTILNTFSFEKRASSPSTASDDTPRVTNKVVGGAVNFAWLAHCVTDCAGVDGPLKESDLALTGAEAGEKNKPKSTQRPNHKMSYESEIKTAASFSSVNSQARSLSKLQELGVKHRRTVSPTSLAKVTETQKLGTERRCHIAETPSVPRQVESRGSFGVEDNATIASYLSRTKSQNLHNDEVLSCLSNVELGLIKGNEGDELSGLQVVQLSRSRATSPVPEVGLLNNSVDEQEKPRKLEPPSGRTTPTYYAEAFLSAVRDADDSHPEEFIELDVNSLLGEDDAADLQIHELTRASSDKEQPNVEEAIELTETVLLNRNNSGANDVDNALGDDVEDDDCALNLSRDTNESTLVTVADTAPIPTVLRTDERDQFGREMDTLVINEPTSVVRASHELDRYQLNNAGGNLGNDAFTSTTSAMTVKDEFEKLRSMDKLKELGLEHAKNSPNSTAIAPTRSESPFGVDPVDLFQGALGEHGVISEPLPPAEKDKTIDLPQENLSYIIAHRPDATPSSDGPKPPPMSSSGSRKSVVDGSVGSNSLSVDDSSTFSSSKGTKSTGGGTKSTWTDSQAIAAALPPFSVNGAEWDEGPACNGLSPVIEMLDYAFNGEDDETISDASSFSEEESDTSSFVRKKNKTKPKRRDSRRRYSKNSRRRRRRRSKSSRQKSAPHIDLVYSPILEQHEGNKANKELELLEEKAPNRDYLVSFSPSTLEKELQTTEDVDLLNALLHDAPLTTLSASAEDSCCSYDELDNLQNLTKTNSSKASKASKSGETAAASNAAESLNVVGLKKIDRFSRSFQDKSLKLRRRIRTGDKDPYRKLA